MQNDNLKIRHDAFKALYQCHGMLCCAVLCRVVSAALLKLLKPLTSSVSKPSCSVPCWPGSKRRPTVL